MQPFKPEPQRLYRQIAERLRSAILAGDYRPGDRLPAERDLAHILGVSRPSVREALIALEVDGWVEVRTGSGVYVLERTPSATELTASDEWGPLELIRARRLVEGETAALAAEYAQPMHLQAMHTALAAMCADADAETSAGQRPRLSYRLGASLWQQRVDGHGARLLGGTPQPHV